MNSPVNSFDYTYINNNTSNTLFLLHGTGGNKNDFLFLNEALKHKYNLVGLQGNILENGMPRFFKRLAPGIFDQKSIEEESTKLADFITNWQSANPKTSKNIYTLGYSNGANILLSTLFYFPNLLKNLILLHPMLPFEPENMSLTTSHKIYLTNGASDAMVTKDQQNHLVDLLKSTQSQLYVREYLSGHEITDSEVKDLIIYLSS